LHYSTQYAVNRRSILDILSAYCEAPADAFRSTDYGITLNEDERLRRHVLATVLSTRGMDIAQFLTRFGLARVRDFRQLANLIDAGLLEENAGRLQPTVEGWNCLTLSGRGSIRLRCGNMPCGKAAHDRQALISVIYPWPKAWRKR
jgi:coproporphyrinogen III oxidase-like Fe-S oxidoreductase